MSEQPVNVTVYEYVGGTPFFERLVAHFYDGVAHDPVLRPMYPDDLSESRAHLVGFLVQYWGGPTDYSDARARDAWFAHMTAAVAASGADDVVAPALLDYFAHAATAMINTHDGEL